MNHSSALVCSTRPRVSVYSTGPPHLNFPVFPSGLLVGSIPQPSAWGPPRLPPGWLSPLPPSPSTPIHPPFPLLSPFLPPSLYQSIKNNRFFNLFPFPPPFSDSPTPLADSPAINIAFGGGGSAPQFVTYAYICFSCRSSQPRG